MFEAALAVLRAPDTMAIDFPVFVAVYRDSIPIEILSEPDALFRPDELPIDILLLPFNNKFEEEIPKAKLSDPPFKVYKLLVPTAILLFPF